MTTIATSVAESCALAKRASRTLATLGSGVKDAALEAIAAALIDSTEEILEANARDLDAGRDAGHSSAFLDRLALDKSRIAAMASGVRTIASLPDPVGEVIEGSRLPNGLELRKVRVPLGVIAVVYEARPNVTIDAAALCLKSGNAVVLRGSSSAAHSNAALSTIASAAATTAGLPDGAITLIGGAQGRRNGARDLRRIRQLPRLRGRHRGSRSRAGDRPQREAPAPGRLQRRRDAAGALCDRRRVPAAAAGRAR
jgi:glutamate-5-semialdehyde dehydrogenase